MWSRFVMSQVKHNSYFLCGVALGLWVSLAVIPLDEEPGCAVLGAGAGAGVTVGDAAPDEYEPAREERPLGAAGQAAGRSVQRPRYYSTELGMRGSLLCGILSSEDALKSQVAALNKTMARLQPALKFFITASAMSAVPGLANVVGFTDTREMLKPFHALKYLADNYLEEYDFFFLALDGAFVNARRLRDLVARLSVSQDVYMGAVAEDDSHYCSLDSGIILSNSVLRAVHGELDWCVRNSYSAHHHENLGRCVLHAAHLPCQTQHQGESYLTVRLPGDADAGGALTPSLADAVSVLPAAPAALHTLHAYVSRVQLERAGADVRRLRGTLWSLAARRPAGARNASWPCGLRREPGRAATPPDTRFEHLRWSLFNASHSFMPDEHRAAARLAPPYDQAIQLVVDSVKSWSLRRWAWAREATVSEGAWQWDPPVALRYRLLVTLTAPDGTQVMRQVECARALGAARLVPVRYVTESARVALVLPVPLGVSTALPDTLALLQRHRAHRHNTFLHIVVFHSAEANSSSATAALDSLRAGLASLGAGAGLVTVARDALPAQELLQPEPELWARLGRRAVSALSPRPAPDTLLLFLVPHIEFNQDFLNRVRMSTIPGSSWSCPLPFRRHAVSAHVSRARARTHTGRFNQHAREILSVYQADLDAALSSWTGSPTCGLSEVLAASALRCVRAPDPAAVLPPRPRPPPCTAPAPPCPLSVLDLGQRTTLAQLLLEQQHEQL